MKIFSTALVLLLAASSADAQGVTMVLRETARGQTTTNQMQMDRTHVRAETRTNNDQMAFIYDGPAKVIRMVNYGQKSYTEMTQDQMAQMGQQINAAMAAMQEQLKNMPPAQRKMMEDMMKGRGGMPGATAPAPPVYKNTGSDKVGQWACTKYEGYRGTEKILEICTVEPTALGLTAADFEAARQLAEVIKGMIPQAGEQLALAGTVEKEGYNGFPVRRTSFRNGQAESTTELTEIRREAIPASAFAAPAGFRRDPMPGAPR